VRLSSTLLSIDIVDDGVGFEPTTVAPHRLGIAVSIIGRVQSLPGGVAYVRSSPGEGTQVHLEWPLR
jgi:signal transduction histidine kinase